MGDTIDYYENDSPNTLTASLQRDKTLPHHECPGYDIKQSDGEVPVMWEL